MRESFSPASASWAASCLSGERPNPPMRTIALLIEYDGTDYAGWQIQENAVTVQEVIEKALGKLSGRRVRVMGSGRTDAGVHAEGQVCSFAIESDLPLSAFSRGLNTHLPRDVRVLEARDCEPDFHARRSAVRKCYRYHIFNRSVPTALWRNRAWAIESPLDWEAFGEAAGSFVGTHDFAAFCAAGAATRTTTRTLESIELRRSGPLYSLEVVGGGFLRGQVRSMVGTLVEIARGKVPIEKVARLLKRPERDEVGATAPPQGLTLRWVDYGEGPWRAPGGEISGGEILRREPS